MVDWITPAELEAMWDDAEGIDVATQQALLDAAQDACEAWVPAEDDPERPRDTTIRLAQLTLVRGLWNDAIADEGGSVGADGFDYNPPWLAREARRMMRPPRGGAPATGHDPDVPVVDPVTLTWPDGSTVALSRAGGVVTATATPADPDTLPGGTQELPAAFTPAGIAYQIAFASLPTSEPGRYLLTIIEDAATATVQFMPTGNPGPYQPFTTRWAADPTGGV